MTTATSSDRFGIGPEMLQEYLQQLLDCAQDMARSAELMEKAASTIEESDWQFAPDAPEYVAAVDAQIARAIRVLPSGSDPQAPEVICDAIREAIDVLEFAVGRSGNGD